VRSRHASIFYPAVVAVVANMQESTTVAGKLQDKLMFNLIGNQIIYNISWEDPRIDRALLKLGPDDVLMMLTSAGCNVLDYLLEGPKKIVSVDLNPRQNALLAIKLAAIRELEHEDFFTLFAVGDKELFQRVYGSKLRQHLNEEAREFFDENGSYFFEKIMWRGMSGRAAENIRKIASLLGLGSFIEALKDCRNMSEQRELYDQYRGRVQTMATVVNGSRRIWAPFIGVPDSQLELFHGNIVQKLIDHIMESTFIAKDNYFYYGYFYGHFTKDCCPRYLQKQHFSTLKKYVDRVEIRTGTLKDVCASYPDETFTRYVLLDHQDWLSTEAILDEWEVFAQKSQRGKAHVLWRSFASHQHIGPLKYLDFSADVPKIEAAYPDRVAMYNSCHYARIPSREEGFTIVKRTPFRPKASCCDDVNVLFANFVHPISGASHQEKLESFYRGQASSYDVFRHRFLHGRKLMLENMPTPPGGVWLDLGGGTAANLEDLKESIQIFSRVIVLDLCRPLLEVAKQRVSENGWSNVELIHGDATDPTLFDPESIDVITFSYSLTMIPDWKSALDNALRYLKPGGHICVADFTVTKEHYYLTRKFWKSVFANDNVRPNEEHIPTLRRMFDETCSSVKNGGFPYVPFCIKSPYYYFVGQKSIADNDTVVHEEDSIRQGTGVRRRQRRH
jgi:S-adenosylmethionine:diacylglycerol 3-amino-3-carboxypropyl transferase/ubiquinone/menaquinone biosynthesis C-methylase UbiE